MKNKYKILLVVLGFLCTVPCIAGKPTEKPSNDIIVAAYIWPSCHDDPLARKWIWTEGIGEWEVIKKGNPRFEGHYQPKQPLWGYEMDNDPQVVEKWINTALKYGVNTFIYDWYWYKDPDGYNGPYLESALDDGFLGAPSNEKMNFYIMWANHDVKYNYWNCHKWGDNTDILFDPKVNWNEFPQIVDRIISQYFTRPNYLKIDGKPVFAIYNFDNLIKGFGSLEETQKALAYLEEKVKAAGFPGIHIQESFGGGPRLNEKNTAVYRSHVDLYGVDSFAFYNMGGFDTDYVRHCDNAVTIREQWDKAFDIPVFPCVSVAWDDTPRFPAKGKEKVTCFHDTPQVFGNYLSKALEYVKAHPEQPPIVMINAWNEWVEGSYLLPDMVNGFGYLEAVQKALEGR